MKTLRPTDIAVVSGSPVASPLGGDCTEFILDDWNDYDHGGRDPLDDTDAGCDDS